MLIHPSHQPHAGRSLIAVIAAAIFFVLAQLAYPTPTGPHVPNYLFWHTLLQGLSIIMAAQIFTLILSTYQNTLQTTLIVLGVIFLGVAAFDFFHTLAHHGMPRYLDTDYQSKAPYLFYFARLLSACGLLFISLYPWERPFNSRYFIRLLITFLLFISLLNWVIFYQPDWLPGFDNLTFISLPVKTVIEVLLLLLFVLAAGILFYRLRLPQQYNVVGFFVAACLFALAQAMLILHPYESELYHLMSHVYAIVAIYILYRAVFNEIVLRPYTLLKDSEQRISATLEASPDVIFELDGRGRYLKVHSKSSANELLINKYYVGKTLDEIVSPESSAVYWDSLREAKKLGVSRNQLIKQKTSTNALRWFELSVSYLPATDEVGERFIVIARDITERIQETEKLNLLSHAVNQNPSIIFILNEDFRIQFVNDTFTRITGYSFDEVIDKEIKILFAPTPLQDIQKHITEELRAGNIWQGEIERVNKSGQQYTVQSFIYPILNANKQVNSYLVIENDITESKKIARQLQRVSNFDRLTGLPNATRLSVLLDHSLKNSPNVAVLWINLDHFKNINEGLGHQVGDQLLKEIADRLSNLLRPQDIVARPSSDNFVMLLPDATHSLAANSAQAVLDSLKEPLYTANRPIVLSATIGIALFPWDGTDVGTLLGQAETAMHRMKQESRGTFCFYKTQMREETAHKLVLSMALKEALNNQELYLVYQPQIHIKTGKIIGVEALLRWRSPIWGNTSPAEFIPIAEESGDIVPIGKWVIKQALQQIQDWSDRGIPIPSISVNISALQFERDDFVPTVTSLLSNADTAPYQLEFELTEAVAMKDPVYSAVQMQQLNEAKIRISIDDFGTGYSSLSSLKSFRISTIKIDRSFIKDICTDSGDQAIVNAIINMAHDLGMRTIAEGVENKDQLDYLRAQGCYAAQGFYFSYPMTPYELEEKIHSDYRDGRFPIPEPRPNRTEPRREKRNYPGP